MPTYYLLKSGALEKHGVKFQEFAVASGNLTMQQMVARQVDMGTYAGQSFTIGHDKGGLVAIAMIEYVGKTAQIVTRKDLNITKVEQLKGKKVANQVGSSVGNIFVDIIAPKRRAEEGRLPGSPHERQQHDLRAWPPRRSTPWSTSSPTTRSRSPTASARRSWTSPSVDRMPVFMAATPDFVDKNADTVVAYLKAWQDVARDFKEQPEQGRGRDLFVLHLQGLQACRRTPSPRRWRASR